MCKTDLQKYATQVNIVRVLQVAYFTQSATARKTRLPEEYAKAKDLLAECKAAEKELDETTDQILFKKEVQHA